MPHVEEKLDTYMPLGLVFIQLHVTLHLHHLEEAKINISLDTVPLAPPALLYFSSPGISQIPT